MRGRTGLSGALLAAVLSVVLGVAGCDLIDQQHSGGASNPRPEETARDRARAAESRIAPTGPEASDDPATAGSPRSSPGAPPQGRPGSSSGPPARSGTSTATPSPSGSDSVGDSPAPSDSPEGGQPDSLERGQEGPRVRSLQRTLQRLHYDPGGVDGVYGASTQYAVWAFQKVNGLDPDGVVGPKTRDALRDPRHPEPLVPGGDADRVEIDLTRQLLYVYDGGRLALISHVSSGSQEPYCTGDGHCGDAVTPTGDFDTTWRVDGWRTSDLGRLYNPVYFVGGIAVHGYPSVPRYPVSHGCVRIPMHTAETFPDLVGDGEAVHVRAP